MASVGPPSRRSDWTPSPRAVGAPPERPGDELERGLRPEAARAEGEAPRLALGADVAGIEARRIRLTVPIPTATASEAARSSCTRRRLSSPVTQREPGTVTRPSSVTAAL